MKKILFALLLLPFCGFSQTQYRESGDTIFVNNKMLLPGDTVHLGMGSDPYKNFLFVKTAYSDEYRTQKLTAANAFGFMIYKGIKVLESVVPGRKFYEPNFLYGIIDAPMAHYTINLKAAIASKEVLNF